MYFITHSESVFIRVLHEHEQKFRYEHGHAHNRNELFMQSSTEIHSHE